MTAGIKANADGSAAIQVGGSDAISITSGLNTTFAGTVTSPTGTLYPLVSGAAQTASGTSVDFTGIPSTAKRITVIINGLSYAAAGGGVGGVQIGSGSLTTTGYTSGTTAQVGGPVINVGTQTTNFGILNTSAAGSTVTATYVLHNITGNTWVFSEVGFRFTDNTSIIGSGFIALGGVLDRLSVVATTSTFDAGTINIMWE